MASVASHRSGARRAYRIAGLATALALRAASSSAAETDRTDEEQPLAGYQDGLFYLRDRHDNFRLYVEGQMNVDFYGYLGPGVPETALKPTLFLRRVRPAISGEILHNWHFVVAGDFGATALANPKGTNQTFAASPGATPTATSGRYTSAETTLFQAASVDVFLDYRIGPLASIMVGQMDAPFTMENRISDKFIPFMERSLPVRAVGIPSNKEIGAMFWGETTNRLWYYSVGPYMGDGENRPNVDARFDVLARTFVHPLVKSRATSLRDVHVGGSFRYGSRDRSWVFYDYASMSTQGNYAFWSPTYSGASGTNHIIPAGNQLAIAGEVRIPIDRFELTSEVVYIDNGTREAPDGEQATSSLRFGAMKGTAYYVMGTIWAFGNRRIIGEPGYEKPVQLDWSKKAPAVPDQALQLLVKWEQLSLNYASASRSGAPDPDNIDGDIRVNAVSLGANLWASRHVRVSLDYVFNSFPSSAPVKATAPRAPAQSSSNRAQAPGNTIATGLDDSARNSAHSLQEILARFAIAL